MNDNEILSIVVGTYARIKQPLSYVDGIPLYEWSCVVYYPTRPYLDLSAYIDKVEFGLHPSFENPLRKVTQAPFGISAEGWGEFPISVEIFPKYGKAVKIDHYLKLNVPEKIVVNETFDAIPCSQAVVSNVHVSSDIEDMGEFPVFAEYVLQGKLVDYIGIEDEFISLNSSLLERLKNSVETLSAKALEKEIEWLSLLNRKT